MTYMRSLALKLVAAAADGDDDVEMTQMLSIVTCEYWQLRHRVHSLKPYIYQQHRLHGVALLTDSQTLHLISLTLCLVLYSRLHTHTHNTAYNICHMKTKKTTIFGATRIFVQVPDVDYSALLD